MDRATVRAQSGDRGSPRAVGPGPRGTEEREVLSPLRPPWLPAFPTFAFYLHHGPHQDCECPAACRAGRC